MRFLLIALLYLGACANTPEPSGEASARQAFEDMRTSIREVLQDSSQEEALILGLIDQFEADFWQLREVSRLRRERFRSLNADYNSTREDFEVFYATHDKQVVQSHEQFRQSRRALRDALTEEEWSALSAASNRYMAALAKSLAAP